MDGEGDNKRNFKALDESRKSVAVAIKGGVTDESRPVITAAARGALAEKIVQIALAQGVKIREDQDLAGMLAELELDSPIPTEALMAVAEVLSYVYKANGEIYPGNGDTSI